MERNYFGQTPSAKEQMNRYNSEKFSRYSEASNELLEPQEDLDSSKRIITSSSGNIRANILYKNGTDHASAPQITLSSTSPVKVMDQSLQSTSSNRNITPLHFDPKASGPIRTYTYSPVNSSKLGSSMNKGSPQTNFDPGNFFYESPGKKKINLNNSSVQVMKKVFDEEFSLHSPSKKKTTDTELYESIRLQSHGDQSSSKSDFRPQEIERDILHDAYKTFWENLQSNPEMKNATIDAYVGESLSCLSHSDDYLRLGAIINIFDMIYYTRASIPPDQISQICSYILDLLPKYYTVDDLYCLYCSLEVLGKLSYSYLTLCILS